MREFETGATRDNDDDKYDYEGFFSPLVLARRAEYMHRHRLQADGVLRDSDNWQKGMGFPVYMKSAWRHFMDWWRLHRRWTASAADPVENDIEEAICALMFNAEGYLHELLSEKAQRNKGLTVRLTVTQEPAKVYPDGTHRRYGAGPYSREDRFGNYDEF